MSRTVALAAVVLALILAIVAWRWWSVPAGTPAVELAAALSVVPATAEGALAVGTSTRTLTWLARHPQAVGLLGLAAPPAAASANRLKGAAAAFVSAARGPVAVWWRGADVALASPVSQGSRTALATVASRAGLRFRMVGSAAVVLTSTALLDGPPLELPDASSERLAALAHVAGTWWQVRVAPSSLEATASEGAELPPLGSGSAAEIANASALLRAVESSLELPAQPARVSFNGPQRWAVFLPGLTLPELFTQILGDRAPPTTDAQRGPQPWDGIFGDVWVSSQGGFAVASQREALTPAFLDPRLGQEGHVRVEDLEWAAESLAAVAEKIPLFEHHATSLREGAEQLDGLHSLRWRFADRGARLRLEW